MKLRLLATTLLAAALCSGQASATTLFKDEEKGVVVNVGVLAQPWFQFTAPGAANQGSPGIGAADGKSPSFDFFLRRVRLMAYGSVTKELSYFIETDQPNLGKGGDFTSSMFIQDAFFSYAFMPELTLDAGMMLVPLSHHTIEGAVGLNALDYHGEMIRFPAGKIFRDTGIQLRGMLLNKLIHYRFGVFEGVRQAAVAPPAMPPATPQEPLNDNGLPRLAAQVRVNIFGDESDFFLKGIYFTPKPLLSVGVGLDLQSKAVRKLNGTPGTYRAFSADVFLDYPFSDDDELVFKANVFNYGEGASGVPGSTALAAGGTAFYAEAGVRHASVEPLVFVEYLKANNDTLTILSPHLGANFWVTKHTFNVKADLGYRATEHPASAPATGDVTLKDWLGTVQGQVFF
ncbi:MAG TPA: porin [Polyangiaceae bacterium]|nr:porin [Polyangiaceae bacterium]